MEISNLNQVKTCSKCLKNMPINNFQISNGSHVSTCKTCLAKARVLKKRTKEGLFAEIYTEQKESSKTRDHTPPEYTRLELTEWALAQSNFEALYANWVSSGYDRWTRPSIDRLDNKTPYKFGNIQLVSWQENNLKSHVDKLTGIDKIDSITVYKYSLSGEYIEEYHSISEAARLNNVTTSAICRVLKSGGSSNNYQWSYTKEIKISKFTTNYTSKGKIKQYTKGNQFIKEWSSGAEIAKYFELKNGSSIHAVCKGINKSAKGFIWKYSVPEPDYKG